jgi:ABC-type multidrug transport system fused ATPase/permease subunit
MRRLAVYGLALIVSYSGTGLIVLAVCLPLCLVTQRRWGLLVLGLLVLAVIVAIQLHFHANRLLARIGEFDSDQSSAYMRFVGGFRLFDRFLWEDFWRTLFGYGAGSFVSYSSRVHYYAAAEMALFKIVFEFGLVGAVAYFGFLFSCLYYSSAPRLLTLAVGITFFLNGIYVPFAHGLALSLLLWNAAPDAGVCPGVSGRKRTHDELSSAALPLPRGI